MDSASTGVAFASCCGWPSRSCVCNCAEAYNSLARRQVASGLPSCRIKGWWEMRMRELAIFEIWCPFLYIVKK